MATEYQVEIDMDPQTVNALHSSNFRLYGFKAVRTDVGGGAPLVWFRTDNYSTNTDISWKTQFQAYTSTDAIIPDGKVEASFSENVDLGQTLNVDKAGGVGTVVGGGVKAAISILNKTATQYTCGISQVRDGKANPLCAFPLYGNHLDVIAPIEKVLLLFSTLPVNTGSVIEQAYGPGIYVDLTGAKDNLRKVRYDINKGWSWDGGVWAKQVAPNESLVPLLIQNHASAVRAMRVA